MSGTCAWLSLSQSLLPILISSTVGRQFSSCFVVCYAQKITTTNFSVFFSLLFSQQRTLPFFMRFSWCLCCFISVTIFICLTQNKCSIFCKQIWLHKTKQVQLLLGCVYNENLRIMPKWSDERRKKRNMIFFALVADEQRKIWMFEFGKRKSSWVRNLSKDKIIIIVIFLGENRNNNKKIPTWTQKKTISYCTWCTRKCKLSNDIY